MSDIPRIPRNSIRFDFVGYGTTAPKNLAESDSVWLDVGNDLRPGVICHHQIETDFGSASSLVCVNPEYILKAIKTSRSENDKFTIYMHEKPDLDCIVSSFLVMHLLEKGSFPKNHESLCSYVDYVDAGNMGMTQRNPFTLYSACMFLAHEYSQKSKNQDKSVWKKQLNQSFEVVDYVLNEINKSQISIMDIDAFKTPGLFREANRREVKDDIGRYLTKLSNLSTKTRILKLHLPSNFGAYSCVDTLLVRNVQDDDDPDRVLFFKDWARTDEKNAPDKKGFIGLSVFVKKSNVSHRRCIISVPPKKGVHLNGLGELLDNAESAKRKSLDPNGIDHRCDNPENFKPGYSNSDPWYDGRGHGYTIIDAPRSGTVLSADEIEAIFTEYGKCEAHSNLNKIQTQQEDSSRIQIREPDKNTSETAATKIVKTKDIFISYSRAHLEHVKNTIYEPLKKWIPEDKIWIDFVSIKPGDIWLKSITKGIIESRIFLALYCEEYFKSRNCEIEWFYAHSLDPTKGSSLKESVDTIIIPMIIKGMNPDDIPPLYGLIQAQIEDDIHKPIETRLKHIL